MLKNSFHKLVLVIAFGFLVVGTVIPPSEAVLIPETTGAVRTTSIVQGPTPPAPVTIAPDGNDPGFINPTFKWHPSFGATKYRLRVYSYNDKGYIAIQLLNSSVCSPTKCTYKFTPSLSLGAGVYYFNVAAKNAFGFSAYSDDRVFSRCDDTTGFDSQFNGDATCWMPNYGAPWKWNSKRYYSKGLTGTSTNTSYAVDYSDFVYEAQVKRRTGDDFPNTGLLLRGDTSAQTDNGWNNTYDFGFGVNGQYCVHKRVSGTWTVIQPCTDTPAIRKGAKWNKIKVRAKGNKFWYTINGTLVWSGTDSSFTTGKVGFNMWRGGGTDKVLINYAKLTVLPLGAEFEGEVSPEQLSLNDAALRAAGLPVPERD